MPNLLKLISKFVIALLFVAGITCISTVVFGQRLTWFQSYNSENNDFFYDLFRTDDGGLVACGISKDFMNTIPRPGRALVIRLNAEYEVVWQRSYGNDYLSILRSIIETDAGELLIAGESNAESPGHGEFSALKLTAEGNLIWWRNYGPGACYAAIELKGGEFILAGFQVENNVRISRLMRINNNGDIIWSRNYSPGSSTTFVGVRETPDETVVAGGRRWGPIGTPRSWLVKATQDDGAQIWAAAYDDLITTEAMISTGDGGFLLAGRPVSGVAVGKYDSHGQQVFYRTYQLDVERHRSDQTMGVARLSNGGFAVCGLVAIALPIGVQYMPFILRINRFGDELSQTFYETTEWRQNFGGRNSIAGFFSIIRNPADELIACGTVTDNSHGGAYNNDALLIQFESDVPPPPGIEYFPLDTTLVFLPDTRQRFYIRAIARPAGDFDYRWIYRDTIRATTFDYNPRFRDLGRFEVAGRISEGERGREIHWQIWVTKLFISDYQPDTLHLLVRRGTSQDFGIVVSATQDDSLGEPSIEWQLTDLTDNRTSIIATDTNRTSILFERSRPHRVSVIARRGEDSDRVDWSVEVRGIINTFWPENSQISIIAGESIEFGIIPFNPESDSLIWSWTLDGDEVGQDTTVILAFPYAGNYTVRVHGFEGAERDSQFWAVNVVVPDFVGTSKLQNPKFKIDVIPNPFNSLTEVRFETVSAGKVRLEIRDLCGRLVRRVIDGDMTAERHTISIESGDLPAGIYLLHLRTEVGASNRKMLLLK